MTSATVTCKHSEVLWELPPDNISLANSTDIWRVPVESGSGLLSMLDPLLLGAELEKASRFRQIKDKHRFITRKAVLRLILSRYLHFPATDIQFLIGKNKKPALASLHHPDLHFNVSHSGDWILIAISGSETGVDVEQLNTGFDYSSVLEESFSLTETAYIKHETDARKAFFMLWTRKEALTKATSKGLDDDFSVIPCLDGSHEVDSELLWTDQNWSVSSFDVGPGHTGSVASSPSKALRFFDFTFPQGKL